MLIPAMLVPACMKFISGWLDVSSCSVINAPPVSASSGIMCESQGISVGSDDGPRYQAREPALPTL